MWLRRPKVPQIASEIVSALTANQDVETDSPREMQADIEAVLIQYINDEQAVSERARDLVGARGLPPSDLGRMRKLVAEEKGIKLGDDALDYILDQLVEMLMHSHNVEEIYAEDVVLRRKMRDPLRRQMAADEQLEQEVRGRLKHVQEGTQMWEIEYRRMMEDIKRRKGI